MNIKLGLLLLVATTALSACSTSRSMLGLGDGPAPASAPVVQTNNPLALPPDMSLRQPGTAAAARQPDAIASAPLDADVDAITTPSAPVAQAPKPDAFAEYGISKTNPDGTTKDATQLQKELKAAVLKRKQQQNPNYGTIFNMGSVFRDG